jgi:hypothetical protein
MRGFLRLNFLRKNKLFYQKASIFYNEIGSFSTGALSSNSESFLLIIMKINLIKILILFKKHPESFKLNKKKLPKFIQKSSI